MNEAGVPTATLVTGAASGIGRACALRLARDGHALSLLDRDADGLATTEHLATSAGAARVAARVVDLTHRRAVDQACREAADLGTFTGIVSCAGILEPAGLSEVDAESWQRHFDVNTTGLLHLLQAGTPHLTYGGSVVTVSSNAARVPRTGMIAYAASKAAASALTRCAGLELAARGIRCNVVEPGSTDTPMQRDLWPDPELGNRAAIEGDPAAYRVGIPLGRIADPEDIADVVAFLLSPASRHVTLQQMYVDGGASL